MPSQVVEIKWNGATRHGQIKLLNKHKSYLPHLYPQGKRTPLM